MKYPKKGEIKVYYDVLGFSASGMYVNLKTFDSYNEALKYCSDLHWTCEFYTSEEKLDLDCKIIKVTSEVLT